MTAPSPPYLKVWMTAPSLPYLRVWMTAPSPPYRRVWMTAPSPPYLRVWMTAPLPPLISRSGSATVINLFSLIKLVYRVRASVLLTSSNLRLGSAFELF